MTGDNLPRESLNKKPNIKIAKIDATKNKVMADKFSVTSFPTIKYVNNGMLSEYTGIRTKKNFLSFINIMLGDHLIRINSLEDLRTLQLTNILSDTGNSNIIFLLTIYRTENNMKNSMKKNVFTFSSDENKNKSENENENKNKNESEKEYKSDNKNEMINERNSKEIEIENTFSHLAKKLQGKAIFTILYKDIDRDKILKNSEVNNDNEDEDENEKEDIPFQDNDNILSGFYSLSKREINRPPIFLKKQYGIRNKNHNGDNNNDDRSDDNNNNSNNNNNDSKKKNENNNNSSNKNENNISNNNNNNEIISSQLLEGFILSHNRPTISKLSQHNFRDLMDLSKVMVIAVVNGVSTIRINNKNNKDYFSMINNSNNNGNHNNEKNNNNIINNNNNNNNDRNNKDNNNNNNGNDHNDNNNDYNDKNINKSEYGGKNENKNENEIFNSKTVDQDNILKYFEKHILEKLNGKENSMKRNFNQILNDNLDNNLNVNDNDNGNGMNKIDINLNSNLDLNLNDFIFGYLDSNKWKRFLKQYGVKSPCILILDFRTPTLYFYKKSLREDIKKNNKIIKSTYQTYFSGNKYNNNNNNNDNVEVTINRILEDLYHNKIRFQKLKNTSEILHDVILSINNKFLTYHPYSILICFIILLILFSLFTSSPSIKIKKN